MRKATPDQPMMGEGVTHATDWEAWYKFECELEEGMKAQELIDEAIKNPAFRATWNALDIYRELANAILEARAAKLISSTQLAEAAGLSLSGLLNIEHERPNARLDTLQKIADGLNMRWEMRLVPKEGE